LHFEKTGKVAGGADVGCVAFITQEDKYGATLPIRLLFLWFPFSLIDFDRVLLRFW